VREKGKDEPERGRNGDDEERVGETVNGRNGKREVFDSPIHRFPGSGFSYFP
jgi:hypothetical protein